MRAEGIARGLEKGFRNGTTWMACCPVHADKTPSLAIKDTPGGVVVHCHGGCSQDDVLWELDRRGLWPWPVRERGANLHSGAADSRQMQNSLATKQTRPKRERAGRPTPPGAYKGRTADERERITAALNIWAAAEPVPGTIAERYLKSRELDLPAEGDEVLRFHPRLWWTEGRMEVGTLLALFRDVVSNEPVGIHRVFLDDDGDKVGKKMLGVVGGAAVKISPDEAVEYGLGIAEGVETALALWCWGWRPVWATGSAGAIAAFPVLPGIDCLTILGDNDANDTGLKAAKTAQARWRAANKECRVLIPRARGVDWADEWGVR